MFGASAPSRSSPDSSLISGREALAPPIARASAGTRYVAVYQVGDNEITILRFFHVRQRR
ncbi:MAG: hypothetical protein JNJ73_00770 [Hyphomonadaceae bacterium]|nr:hypothetical protein [Hyphomonadaceae bacterium]